MSWRRVTARVGVAIFGFGVLVLLFVAYQLWGTSITTQLHQDSLRTQFDHELAILKAKRHDTTATTLPTASTTTTTTQPFNGVAPAVPGLAPGEGMPIGTIDIPSISADYVVVQGTNTSDLELGPGHYANTPLPGQPGNAAIAGHRTTYLHPFYNLNELAPGDPIYVTTTQGRFKYEVVSSQIVAPSDVAVLDPTPVPTLTLTTCNPRFSAAQRLVVQATLVTPPAAIPKGTGPIATPPKHTAGAAETLAGDNGSPWPAVGWGVATACLATAVWLLVKMRRRLAAKVAVAGIGVLAVLVVLFFFFQSISPLLPAAF